MAWGAGTAVPVEAHPPPNSEPIYLQAMIVVVLLSLGRFDPADAGAGFREKRILDLPDVMMTVGKTPDDDDHDPETISLKFPPLAGDLARLRSPTKYCFSGLVHQLTLASNHEVGSPTHWHR